MYYFYSLTHSDLNNLFVTAVVWASLLKTKQQAESRSKRAATFTVCVFYETTYIKSSRCAVNKVRCKTVFVKKLVNIKSHNEVNVKVTVMLHEQRNTT